MRKMERVQQSRMEECDRDLGDTKKDLQLSKCVGSTLTMPYFHCNSTLSHGQRTCLCVFVIFRYKLIKYFMFSFSQSRKYFNVTALLLFLVK